MKQISVSLPSFALSVWSAAASAPITHLPSTGGGKGVIDTNMKNDYYYNRTNPYTGSSSTYGNVSTDNGVESRSGNACKPPDGSTYLVIGQNFFGIDEYANALYRNHLFRVPYVPKPRDQFAPAAVMVYTDLDQLEGLKEPANESRGIQFADGLFNSVFPSVKSDIGLQVGLSLGDIGGLKHITTGARDAKISELANYTMTTTASKVFLRIGYEFDNPKFKLSTRSEDYVEAFQYIVKKLRAHLGTESSKVLFVWHSCAVPIPNSSVTFENFYPGDEFVDWVGVSIFKQFDETSDGGTVQNIKDVIAFGSNHGKPIMIAESSPFGLSHEQTNGINEPYLWNVWFEKVIDLIIKFDISMWSFLNCIWNATENGRLIQEGCRNSELSRNSNILRDWQSFVVDDTLSTRKFLGVRSLNDCGANSDVDKSTSSPVVNQNIPSQNQFINTNQDAGSVDTSDNPQQSEINNDESSVVSNREPVIHKTIQRHNSTGNHEIISSRNSSGGGKVFFVFVMVSGIIYFTHYQSNRQSSYKSARYKITPSGPSRRDGYSEIGSESSLASSSYQGRDIFGVNREEISNLISGKTSPTVINV